jgi:hypothetical protein
METALLTRSYAACSPVFSKIKRLKIRPLQPPRPIQAPLGCQQISFRLDSREFEVVDCVYVHTYKGVHYQLLWLIALGIKSVFTLFFLPQGPLPVDSVRLKDGSYQHEGMTAIVATSLDVGSRDNGSIRRHDIRRYTVRGPKLEDVQSYMNQLRSIDHKFHKPVEA